MGVTFRVIIRYLIELAMALALTAVPSASGSTIALDPMHTIVITSDRGAGAEVGGVSDTLTLDGGKPMDLIEGNNSLEDLTLSLPNENWRKPVIYFLLDRGETNFGRPSDILILSNSGTSAQITYCSDSETMSPMGVTGCIGPRELVPLNRRFNARGQFTVTARTAEIPEPSGMTLTGTLALILVPALIRRRKGRVCRRRGAY